MILPEGSYFTACDQLDADVSKLLADSLDMFPSDSAAVALHYASEFESYNVTAYTLFCRWL